MLNDLLGLRVKDRSQPVLLDIGCSVGTLHPLISSLFKSVEGVDLSKESIARARTNNPSNRYKSYDGQTLPYENNTFDMALAICVMQHVPRKQGFNFLSEMTPVVSPDGLACLIEHNLINPATLNALSMLALYYWDQVICAVAYVPQVWKESRYVISCSFLQINQFLNASNGACIGSLLAHNTSRWVPFLKTWK